MCRGGTPPARRVVHHVVVEQRERMHQLERRSGVDDPGIGRVAAGPDETPVAEGRAQALSTRADHAADLVERPNQVGIDGRPRGALFFEQCVETHVGVAGDGAQARRRGHLHGVRLRPGRPLTRPPAVEVGDDLVDAEAGRADALPAHRDQLRRPSDAVGKAVHVDVAAFELTQDGIELLEGLGVTRALRCVGRSSVVMRRPRRRSRGWWSHQSRTG